MAKPLLPDDLWEEIEPLLPAPTPRRYRYPGRKPIDDRSALTGIIFVLKSGIPWEMLPQEMGCGSGMTCWRRLKAWEEAGVWDAVAKVLLERLHQAHKIDWDRALIDSGSIRAIGGGEKTGPNPTDRAKPGSKHHVLTDGNGIPLSHSLTGANIPDIKQLFPLIDAIPPLESPSGVIHGLPDKVLADRAYDSEPHRKALREQDITPVMAKRRTEHGSGLGVFRWPVERTIGWLHGFKRLRIRFEKRADIHEAFMKLASIIIYWRKLNQNSSFC